MGIVMGLQSRRMGHGLAVISATDTFLGLLRCENVYVSKDIIILFFAFCDSEQLGTLASVDLKIDKKRFLS